MTAPLAGNVLYLPGKLIKNPTQIAGGTFPYGGTELGLIRNARWQPGLTYDRAIAEEWGTTVAAFIEEERSIVACVLRSWDDALLATLFPNTQTDRYGQVGILGRFLGSGVARSGFDITTRSFGLLFAPMAASRQRHLYLHNAYALVEESMELQLSIGREAGFALMFEALPDSQGRSFTFDFPENIQL